MTLKKQKGKKYFINILHGNKHENHKILINERVFNLNDIERWKLYFKLILQYINYLHEINEKDIVLFLREVIGEVNKESKKFKRRMGYLLGNWRYFK